MMNSHRLVRVSSLEGLLNVREKVLPMEQDADPPSASSIVSTSPDGREEIKDGFVEVRKPSKSMVTPKGGLTSSSLKNGGGGYAAKVAAAAAASAAVMSSTSAGGHQRRSSRTSTQGTVTAEYGFRYTNPTQDTLVYIILYKTEKCNRKPCARTCEKYHSVKERRRSPLQYDYSEQPCPSVKAGASSRAWGDPSKCPDGDDCQFSHTLLEQMYHPNIYKTGMCNKFTPDPSTNNCSWSALCTHAHGPQDRERQVRAVAKLRDLIDLGVTDWTMESHVAAGASPERQPVAMASIAQSPIDHASSKASSPVQQEKTSTSRTSVELQVRVEDEEDKHPGISSSDPILRTPVDASPSYDATVNRAQGAPFLSSFSNVSVPHNKANLDRPSSVDRIPIGPMKKIPLGFSGLTPKVDQVSSSPLTQAMNLGSLPMVSPTVQKPTKLERALSGPSSFAAVRNGASFGTPHGSSMLGFSMLNPLMGAGSDGIWGGFSSSVEADSRFGVPSGIAGAPAAVSTQSSEDLKKEVDRLKERTICPECRSEDRAVVVIPCKHFLCQRCAEESSRHKACLKCNSECQAILSVAL